MGYSVRAGTRSTYSSLLRFYHRFCTQCGLDPGVPITEERLCCAAINFCSLRSCRGLDSYFSAIGWWHKAAGYGALPLHGVTYYRVKRGLINIFGQFDRETPAPAISLDQLATMLPFIDLETFDGARGWCALLFAFFGLLRIREYTGDKMALRVEHVRAEAGGIVLTVPWSKADAHPAEVRLVARHDRMCPVLAFSVFSGFFRHPRPPRQPFFPSAPSSSAAVCPATFTSWWRKIGSAAGIDMAEVTGHSLRRGGTTEMFNAGVAETVIKAHGRWRSESFRRYFSSPSSSFLATQSLFSHTRARYPL